MKMKWVTEVAYLVHTMGCFMRLWLLSQMSLLLVAITMAISLAI
ncbi:hypothetical protein [Klebsiella phage ST405-OXA48phi1.3]|nr:hypothetical protein [Klebsiella phage ST405-OXA48phi1.3]